MFDTVSKYNTEFKHIIYPSLMSTLPLTWFENKGNVDIMRTEQYPHNHLGMYFKRHTIATLNQLQRALGNPNERTVFRKLKSLDYLSSYSHRGMYYTLQSIAKFNDEGLWSHQAVWFSRFGNLLDTAAAFIERSEAGYSAAELGEALHVETKHCLLKLIRAGKVQREKIQGCYIYFCSEAKKYRSQQKARVQRKQKQLITTLVANPDLAEDEAKAVVLLFLSTLNERQRRLYAGLESLKLGYGGDSYIADLFGMDPHTVARGRRDLEKGNWDTSRLRAKGGGRSSVEKKRQKS
jgi:hypothetical protein